MLAFLDRGANEDMHLNPDKINIDCETVLFVDNVLSKDGLSQQNTEVQLIKD